MEMTFPDILKKTNAERWLAAAGLSVMTFGAWFLWYFDPTKTHFLPVCPMLSLTGFACPGCGMTRGMHALLHGDVVTRSEEHTSELQSRENLVCRLLLEKKK